MKIKDYIEATPQERDIAEHIIATYIPLEAKQMMAQSIAKATYSDYCRNSAARYMLEKVALVDLYTDIERGESVLDDFNALNEAGVFEELELAMNPKELAEFRRIVAMECEDAEANECEPHAFIAGQVTRFGELIGNVLAPVLAELDTDKIVNAVREIVEGAGAGGDREN